MGTDRGTQAHPGYRPDIDGMRAVAVMAVVIYHAFPGMLHGGFIGVDIFFVISGYLISLVILENLERGRFSFTDFYSRRIRRIFPALLVVLSSSYAFGWFWLLADEFKQLGGHVAAGAAFVSNLLLWSESGYFDPVAESKPLLHLWSLGIEEQFYIVWPLLLWVGWKAKLNLVWVSAALGMGSFAWNLVEVTADSTATFYSPLTRIWELLCGSALAWWTLRHQKTGPSSSASSGNVMGANALSVSGLLFLLAGFWFIRESLAFPGYWAVLPVVGAVCLIAAGPGAWFNRVVLAHPVMVWIGLISFPLYLWHWPMLSFARILAVKGLETNVVLALMALAVLLAWMTYFLVERPIRFKLRGSWITLSLAASMLLAGGLGYATMTSQGFPNRLTSNGSQLSKLTDVLKINHGLGRACAPDKLFDSPACAHGARPDLYLWGDSYAMHLADALKSSEPATAFRQQTFSNCPPIVGLAPFAPPRYSEKWGAGCVAHNQKVLQWLATQEGYEFVVLASPFRMGKQLQFLEGVLPAERERYLHQMKETVMALRRMGKKPVFVSPPPAAGYDMGRCWARMSLANRVDYCDFNYADASSQTIEADQLMQAVSRFAPVFFLKDLVCSDGVCKTEINGVPLYRDVGHFSMAGSAALGARFNMAHKIREMAGEHWDHLP